MTAISARPNAALVLIEFQREWLDPEHGRLHHLQLPRPRHRRRRQPQHILQHRRRDGTRGAVGFGRRVCVR